ncbi:MAG TPA: tetratricopeptide repeat protein, partial [Candidatus Didemnitutus sp.]|nr:tetratricopeptide repeat protein [Candidatus Didemnitutus sp.]
QKPELPPADPWLNALLADCYDTQRLSITFEEYFKTGRMDEAVPVLDRLAALDPNGPIPKMFAGFSHAKALEHITAVREYYDALGKGGDPEKICPFLVQSLLALGKVTEAAQLMADYHTKLPDSQPITKAYAEVALKQGDDKLARGLLEKVLEKEPYLQAQNMSLAKILWAAGERDAAAKCLQRVATVYPNDVASRALLGEYYLGKADPVAAITSLEQARKYLPDHTAAKDSLTASLYSAYLQCGEKESARENWKEAADYFGKAVAIAPSQLDGYVGLANACVQLKQFRRAADVLAKLATLDPQNPTIYLSLGDVVYQGGDAAQARQHWQKARQLLGAGNNELRAALDARLNGPITAETFK